MNNNEPTRLFAGRHISMVARGRWEYATRNTSRPAVGIVAVTQDGNVVLVEQFRPPVGQPILELPAGLAGDIEGAEDEELVEAAKRELFEETGYTAETWIELGSGFSSPGLTDESIVLFLARELTKSGVGGGDASENITVHEVPLPDLLSWIATADCGIDLKLMAALYLAQEHVLR